MSILTKKQVQSARNYANIYSGVFTHKTNDLSFADWMDESGRNVSADTNKYIADCNKELQRDDYLLSAGEGSASDQYTVQERTTDRQGRVQTITAECSKSDLEKNIELLEKQKEQAIGRCRDKRLGMYLFANERAKDRSFVTKLFRAKVREEDNAISDLKNTLIDEYSYTTPLLDSFVVVAGDEKAIDKLDYIDEKGHAVEKVATVGQGSISAEEQEKLKDDLSSEFEVKLGDITPTIAEQQTTIDDLKIGNK